MLTGRALRRATLGKCVHVLVQVVLFLFFFQAEDGIRDSSVTGVQTCALPIFLRWYFAADGLLYFEYQAFGFLDASARGGAQLDNELSGVALRKEFLPDEWVQEEIGRASCRERV